MEYRNRYNEKFTFTLDDEGNILWEGNFEWCRVGWPNDYTQAYNRYVEDDCDSSAMMTRGEFEKAVHETDDNGYTEFSRKYMKHVMSDMSRIDMVDPSGGPYIAVNMDMKYVSKEFDAMIVDGFEIIPTGYKIIIKKHDSRGSKSYGK
jgi:hypothetical protein